MLMVSSEEELWIRRAREGDMEAFDLLLRRYQLPIYAYVFECVRHEQTALDIVQETFVNAIRHLADLREAGKFSGWLFRIAHQKCAQRWRRSKHEPELFDEMPPEHDSDFDTPLDLLLDREESAQLHLALEKLPGPHRAVLVLHFLEDFSLEEIAMITGAERGTVKSRMHYAKKALRNYLEDSK